MFWELTATKLVKKFNGCNKAQTFVINTSVILHNLDKNVYLVLLLYYSFIS